MFVSQVFLNQRKRETARALYNRNILHGALERCFEGGRQHPLWRVDDLGHGRMRLLVLSHDIPDFTSFMEQFGMEGIQPQTKPYDAFLENAIKQGGEMRFFITANPVIKKNGKRVPLTLCRTKNQDYCATDWIRDRMLSAGAEIIQSNISNYGCHVIKKGKEYRPITLLTADFEGYIKIIDREKFVSALVNGIGHGKAYGCGLISVM